MALEQRQADLWRRMVELVRREVGIDFAEVHFKKLDGAVSQSVILVILLRHGERKCRVEFHEDLDRPDDAILEALRAEMEGAMEDFEKRP